MDTTDYDGLGASQAAAGVGVAAGSGAARSTATGGGRVADPLSAPHSPSVAGQPAPFDPLGGGLMPWNVDLTQNVEVVYRSQSSVLPVLARGLKGEDGDILQFSKLFDTKPPHSSAAAPALNRGTVRLPTASDARDQFVTCQSSSDNSDSDGGSTDSDSDSSTHGMDDSGIVSPPIVAFATAPAAPGSAGAATTPLEVASQEESSPRPRKRARVHSPSLPRATRPASAATAAAVARAEAVAHAEGEGGEGKSEALDLDGCEPGRLGVQPLHAEGWEAAIQWGSDSDGSEDGSSDSGVDSASPGGCRPPSRAATRRDPPDMDGGPRHLTRHGVTNSEYGAGTQPSGQPQGTGTGTGSTNGASRGGHQHKCDAPWGIVRGGDQRWTDSHSQRSRSRRSRGGGTNSALAKSEEWWSPLTLVAQHKGKFILRSRLNPALSSGAWLADIVWGTRRHRRQRRRQKRDRRALLPRLVYDMNDPFMIFEHEAPAPPLKLSHTAMVAHQKRLLEMSLRGGKSSQRNQAKAVGRVAAASHSIPAMRLATFVSELRVAELRQHHRPMTAHHPEEFVKLVFKYGQLARRRHRLAGRLVGRMRRESELSARSGRVVLLEYIEEKPPLLHGRGMASTFVAYHREDGSADSETPSVPDGSVKVLSEDDKFPFLGDVQPGQTQQTITNKLFQAPLFLHQAPYTDFLVVRPFRRKGQPNLPVEAVVRPISRIYVVGQIEPLMKVPTPFSRPSTRFIKHYMMLWLRRAFERERPASWSAKRALEAAFPRQSTQSRRTAQQDVAKYTYGRESVPWRVKPGAMTVEELLDVLTPEQVCCHESMMAGQLALEDAGISAKYQSVAPESIASAVNEFTRRRKEMVKHALGDNATDFTDRPSQIARFIYESLLTSPWNLTKSFVEYHLQGNGSGLLKLSGIGDPSGRGEGFSYLKHQMLRTRQPNKNKKRSGTADDARKLDMKKMERMLLKYGVDRETIKTLPRWGRLHMIVDFQNSAQLADKTGTYRFARNTNLTHEELRQQKLLQAVSIWKKQCLALGDTKPARLDEDATEAYDDMFEEDLEQDAKFSVPTATRTKSTVRRKKELEQDEEDKRKFHESLPSLQGQDTNAQAARLQDVNYANGVQVPDFTDVIAPKPSPPPGVRCVLRRVEEVVHSDGTIETVEVYFKDPKLVADFRRRQKTAGGGRNHTRMQIKKDQEKYEKIHQQYLAMEKAGKEVVHPKRRTKVRRCTDCRRYGHQKRDCVFGRRVQSQLNDGVLTIRRGIASKVQTSNKLSFSKLAKKRDEAVVQEHKRLESENEVYKKLLNRGTTSRKLGGNKKKESEVDEPLVKLNTCLEEIVVNMILTTRTNPSLMALVNATKNALFKHAFGNAKPVDLRLMRDKCVSLQYQNQETVRQDMKTLVAACETAYGTTSAVADRARSLLAECQMKLDQQGATLMPLVIAAQKVEAERRARQPTAAPPPQTPAAPSGVGGIGAAPMLSVPLAAAGAGAVDDGEMEVVDEDGEIEIDDDASSVELELSGEEEIIE